MLPISHVSVGVVWLARRRPGEWGVWSLLLLLLLLLLVWWWREMQRHQTASVDDVGARCCDGDDDHVTEAAVEVLATTLP